MEEQMTLDAKSGANPNRAKFSPDVKEVEGYSRAKASRQKWSIAHYPGTAITSMKTLKTRLSSSTNEIFSSFRIKTPFTPGRSTSLASLRKELTKKSPRKPFCELKHENLTPFWKSELKSEATPPNWIYGQLVFSRDANQNMACLLNKMAKCHKNKLNKKDGIG